MRRHAELSVAGTSVAPSEVRRFIRERLRLWGVEQVVPMVELLASELVTNVVLHAHTAMVIGLSLDDGVVQVGVGDSDPQLPVERAARLDLLADLDLAPGAGDTGDLRHPDLHVGGSSVLAGRGLLVVAACSDEWGVTARDGGKEVWFRLAAPAAAPV